MTRRASGGRATFTLRHGHGSDAPSEVDGVVQLLVAQGFELVKVEGHRFEHGGAFIQARRA